MASPQGGGNPSRWRRFTPDLISHDVCMGRIWGGGVGAQCQRQPVSGAGGLCIQHCQQARSKSGLTHGRVDGPIPAAKLAEFERGAAAGSPGAPVQNAAPLAEAGASPSTLQESSVTAAMAAAKMVREMRLENPPSSSPVSDAAVDEEMQYRTPSRLLHRDVPSHWLTFSAVGDGVEPSELQRTEERLDSKATTAAPARAALRGTPRADSAAQAQVPRRLVGKSKVPVLPAAATPPVPQRKSAQQKAAAPRPSALGDDDADREERLMGNAVVAGAAACNGDG